jgi:hypothetical protein
MATPNLPAIRALRPAWNKGRIVGQKRPLKPKHVWAIRVRLELAENHRDLALFNLAIDSKLRGCDLVRMKVIDVMSSGQIKERASVLQSKTQKPVELWSELVFRQFECWRCIWLDFVARRNHQPHKDAPPWTRLPSLNSPVEIA